jgi:hypothetical protein
MGAMCTLMECTAAMYIIWEPCKPYGSHVVPDRGHMVHLRATCTVWSCLHLMVAMCTIWHADGAIWEPLALCGGNMGARNGCMGAACAIWEPCWHRVLVWEVDGITCGPHARCGGHTGAVCVLWEPCALYGSHVAPFEMKMVPFGARIRCMGATGTMWEPQAPCGSHRHHVGATCTMWEPHAPCGSHMRQMEAIWEPCVHYGRQTATYGSCVHAMGAMCSVWHHIRATCALWEPHTPYGS